MTTLPIPSDSLFSLPSQDGASATEGAPDATIDAAFRVFDRAHPEVYRLFKRYAEQIRETGATRISADAIFHRIRWEHHVERGDRDFALNDRFTSRYARLLMAADASFEGYFETRKLRSA